MAVEDPQVVYRVLDPDDPDQAPAEIESMCPRCEENGSTKLLLTRIPFYKKVILMSFSCDECGYRNNELQSGEPAQETGVKLVLQVRTPQDLNRQVVKSEYASIKLPEVDLEIPAKSQPGEITTVEGIVSRCMDALAASQDNRDSATQSAVASYLPRLSGLLSLADGPFTLELTDASGNSFIENPQPQTMDKQLMTIKYERDLADMKLLALVDDDATDEVEQPLTEEDTLKQEVMQFHVPCPNCTQPIQTNMKIVDIPHFKEVVLMATNCSECGYKNTNVQSAKGIGERACRHRLTLGSQADLSRDVLKSDTCVVRVPELDLECGMAALSGRFTTVEGLLDAMRHQLAGDECMVMGDSAGRDDKHNMMAFIERLRRVGQLLDPATLELDDPAANSYIQVLTDDEGADKRLTVEYYERTTEQNEALGLDHMKTDS